MFKYVATILSVMLLSFSSVLAHKPNSLVTGPIIIACTDINPIIRNMNIAAVDVAEADADLNRLIRTGECINAPVAAIEVEDLLHQVVVSLGTKKVLAQAFKVKDIDFFIIAIDLEYKESDL